MKLSRTLTAGVAQLDVHGLAEPWLAAATADWTWTLIARSLGQRPCDWRDDAGRPIYAAVMATDYQVDRAQPVGLWDELRVEVRLLSIRKPHCIGEARFLVGGQQRACLRLLHSLVRRDLPGSNKKLSRVQGVWQAADHHPQLVEAWLDRHHQTRAGQLQGPPALTHRANGAADFNVAGLFYFRNFLALATAAEWAAHQAVAPTQAPAAAPVWTRRQGFFFGNLDEGESLDARVGHGSAHPRTEIRRQTDDALLFISTTGGV